MRKARLTRAEYRAQRRHAPTAALGALLRSPASTMTSRNQSKDPALLLKSTPPRVGRSFLDRERLKLSHFERSSTQVTALLAPTGFGKTSLLASWRREVLARGALAFWYTVDSRDDPLRMVRGLSRSAQSVCGKRGFADPVMQRIDTRSDPHQATTAWLGEVAELAMEVWLLLDDVDLLPTATRTQVLAYLLENS
jgi:LuxR family transcriptional regulator, maltose regulon positive regulatory protein